MKGPIARGTIRTTLALGLRMLVQAGTLLLVTRMLGPQRFGAFAGIAALAVVLGTLSTFGTHLVLLGAVARQPASRERVLSYAVPSTLTFGGGLLVLYLLICRFGLHGAGIPVAVLLSIGSTETLLQPLFTLSAVEHLALGRIARSQLLQSLPLALRLVAAATVFVWHPSDPVAAYGFGYLLASIIALAIATTTMPGPWPHPRTWRLLSKGELRETAGYAALAITATSPAELDKTLAARLLPLPAAGMYAAGARVIGATTLPIAAMMLSALPRLFREGQSQPGSTVRLLRWIFAASLAYGLALATALWFMAPILVWLFGARYQGIQLTIHWLCLAVPGMVLRIAAGSILMALGEPWMRAGFEVLGLLALVISAVILTAHFGTNGMPMALAFSESMMMVSGWILVGFTMVRSLDGGHHERLAH